MKEGYGAKVETLFDSTEEEDIQMIKNQYLKDCSIQIDSEKEKVLARKSN